MTWRLWLLLQALLCYVVALVSGFFLPVEDMGGDYLIGSMFMIGTVSWVIAVGWE